MSNTSNEIDRGIRFTRVNWKRILIGKWSWKRPFISIAWIYLALLFVALFYADSLIFHPPKSPYPENRTGFLTIEKDGEPPIAAFYLPAAEGMPTLLWSHGNAENLSSVCFAMAGLNEAGYGVLAYDYPGYGESPGKPGEKECYRAINAAYHYLIDDLKLAPEKVILAGQSVGSGPTCWLASRENHGGVILISPFLSAFRVATQIPIFPGDRFPNIRNIKEFSTPLLIIHGDEDEVIPFSHGQRLFELSPSNKKTFVPVSGAGHNDLFSRDAMLFFNALSKFSEVVLPR